MINLKIEDLNYNLPDEDVDEKDFDIDKWRKDNPMDYFKAVYMLLSSVDLYPSLPRDIIFATYFEAIYKVTRQYIPNTLYKFCSLTDDENLNEIKLDTLRNKKIYMSDIKAFNDPFDGKAYYYNPEELKGIERLKEFDGKLIDDFTKFHKGTALTENDTSCMPMWAHYANNHQGYCVAYNMKEQQEPAFYACTFPVQYTEDRLDITTFMKRYATLISSDVDSQVTNGNKIIKLNDISIIYVAQFLCNIKHATWQYEKEFRCTIAANAEGSPYIDAIPQAIYIGMNCSENNRKKLVEIATELSIPVYQMEFDELSENYTLKAKII